MSKKMGIGKPSAMPKVVAGAPVPAPAKPKSKAAARAKKVEDAYGNLPIR